jgi:hypothetical protein
VAESVAITNAAELGTWLTDKPDAWAPVIATRAALRVLPLALQDFVSYGVRPDVQPQRKQLLLYTFRSAFIAWVAQTYSASDVRLAARAAYESTTDAAEVSVSSIANVSYTVASAAGAAAYAVATIADVDSAAVIVSISSAVKAVSFAGASNGDVTFWESITEDARWLVRHQSAKLIQQPLWLIDVRGDSNYQVNFPLWARKPFDAFDQSDLVKGSPWIVWTSWYRAILPNGRNVEPRSLFEERADIQIATKDPKFWEREANSVMEDIAEIADLRGVTRGDRSNRKPSPSQDVEDSALEQSPLPPILPALGQQKRGPLLESVEPQSDEPTADDQLGRRPFAQALVERMDKLYQKGGQDGFAAHIHAPWGAGKTSILMMMRDLMIAPDRITADGKLAPRWVVINFNAWEQERRNPPWWPLVELMKAECLKSFSNPNVGWLRMFKECGKHLWYGRDRIQRLDQAALLQARWVWWKIRTDALPYLLAFAVALICLWMLWAVGKSPNGGTPSIFEWMLKVFTAAVAAYATFFSAGRVVFFGSVTAAKFYDDISQDPLKRITGLFKSIVEKTNKPICVFIDDLDRCRADYVVDLLEGIQTSFRYKNVAYVVAADRSWIKASFEERYSTFSNIVGNIGQPLGYLFLEKIFQVSTPVPGMGDKTRSAYWNRLLKGAVLPKQNGQQAAEGANPIQPLSGNVPKEQFDRAVEIRRADLREKHGESLTREQAEAILEKSDTSEERAAVVLELNASRAAEKEAEHLLAQYTGIVPDNPRVMKRMVNAFAMRQAIGILERNMTPAEVLARWTILEQRFPALADLLIEHPEWTPMLANNVADEDREKLSPLLLPFANSEIIRNIIGAADDHPLTVDHVRAITRGSAS